MTSRWLTSRVPKLTHRRFFLHGAENSSFFPAIFAWSLALVLSLPIPLVGTDIFLAGDSTMTSYPESKYPLTGWGVKLPELCKKGVRVYNFARNGASSQSFRDSFWRELISRVKPGDYVLIQFGHNDGFKKDTDPETTFQENLHFFIREVRGKNAVPVLLTQTAICRFRDGKAFNKDVELPFIYATRKVAAEANVELIDHNEWALKKISALGRERAAKMYMNLEKGEYPAYPAGRVDNAHFRESGALFFAEGVVEIAKSQNLSVAKLFR